MNEGERDVLLVGSLPFETVESSFRSVWAGLGRHAAALPDGEVGPRSTWVGFLIGAVLAQHPQLIASIPVGPDYVPVQPGSGDEMAGADAPPLPTFVVAPGETLRFDDLRYGDLAVSSYRILQDLRERGEVGDGVRFQVCLPAPCSAMMAFFSDPAQWPEVFAAYRDQLRQEIAKIAEEVPPGDLAIQFDLAWEVVDLSMGEESFLPFWPSSTVEQKWARHTAWLGELASMVPDGARLGYHWCYGTWGGWPMTAMDDLALCVRLSNEAVRQAPRPVDYVHLPVVPQPSPTFFAPLADLDIGDTEVFLGLVHHTDGVDGFRRRAELARQFLPSFGVASVCGYGRVDPAELPQILTLHTDCAATLS